MRRKSRSFDKLTGARQNGTLRPANSTSGETAATILRDKICPDGETIDRPFVRPCNAQIRELPSGTLSWILAATRMPANIAQRRGSSRRTRYNARARDGRRTFNWSIMGGNGGKKEEKIVRDIGAILPKISSGYFFFMYQKIAPVETRDVIV